MDKFIILCFFVVSILPANAIEQDLVKVQDLDMLMDTCMDEELMDCKVRKNKANRFDGKQTCKDQLGSHATLYESSYRDGKLQGVMKCWGKDGEPRVEAEFRNGLLDGVSKSSWDPKLRMFLAEEAFSKGQKHGFSQSLSMSTRAAGGVSISGKSVRQWHRGKETGLLLVFEGEKITGIGECFVDGQRGHKDEDCRRIDMGPYQPKLEEYYRTEKSAEHDRCNGEKKTMAGDFMARKVVKYTMQDCKIEGVATIWTRDEKRKLVETVFRANKREGKQRVFFEDGKLAIEILYRDDVPSQLTQYYQNSKIKIDAEYSPVDKHRVRINVKHFEDRGGLVETYATLARTQELRSSIYPHVDDQIPTMRLVGCRQVFENDSATSETCFDEAGIQSGKSFFIKAGQRYDQVWEGGKKVTETITDLQSRKTIDSAEFYPDGSRKVSP